MTRLLLALCVLALPFLAACAPRVEPDPGPYTWAHYDATLSCIRQIESGGDDGYGASNGSHFGAYQYSQSLWTAQANEAGFPEYANTRPLWAGAHGEYNVPPHVQDDVAFHTLFAFRAAWREC